MIGSGANAGSIVADMQMRMDNFRAGIREAKDEVKGLKNAGNDFGKSMAQTGATLTKYVTAPIIGVGVMAVKTAGNFEASMNKVRAITGATGDQFDALRSIAMEMGRTTQYTASESADALSFLGMAGFNATESIEALPGVLQLAAAGNMDLATTADYASNILTGYGLEVSELGRVNDVLAKTFTSSNTNMSQLAEAMKYVGPVASGMGMQIEETAAALGMLGDAGIQGSMAGTTLRQAMIQLMTPGGRAADAIEKLGLVTKDSSGEFVGMVSIIEQLEKSGASTADMLDLFGARGAGMIAMVGQGSEKFKDFIVDLENAGGTAQRIAEVQMEGFNGQMKKLKSALEGLLIVIGDQLLPIVTDIALALTDWLSNLAELDAETLKFYMTIAGAVAVIGPFLVVGLKVINMLTSFRMSMMILKGGLAAFAGPAAGAATALSGTAGAAGAAGAKVAGAAGLFAGFGTKLAGLAAVGGPIALVIGALVGLGLMVKHVVDVANYDFRTFEQVAEDSFNKVRQSVEENGLALVESQAQTNLDRINAQIDFYGELETLTEDQEAELAELIDQAALERATIEAAHEAALLMDKAKFHKAVEDQQGTSNDEVIKLAEQHHLDRIAQLEDQTANELEEIFLRHFEAGTLNSDAYEEEMRQQLLHHEDKLEELNELFGIELEAVRDALTERGLVYDEELGKIIPIEEKHFTESLGKWAERVGIMKESGKALGRAAWQGTKEGLDEGQEPVEQSGIDLGIAGGKGIKMGIEQTQDEVAQATRTMTRRAYNAGRNELQAESPSKLFAILGVDIGLGLRAGIMSMLDNVAGAITTMVNNARTAASNVKATFTKTGNDVGAGMAAGIKASTPASTQATREMIDRATINARRMLDSWSPSRVFMDIGRSIPEGLTIGINSLAGGVADAAKATIHTVLEAIRSGVGDIDQIINQVLGRLEETQNLARRAQEIKEDLERRAAIVREGERAPLPTHPNVAAYPYTPAGAYGHLTIDQMKMIFGRLTSGEWVAPSDALYRQYVDAMKASNFPYFHQGGIFKAPKPGGEGLAMLEDGERVIPADTMVVSFKNVLKDFVGGLRRDLPEMSDNIRASGLHNVLDLNVNVKFPDGLPANMNQRELEDVLVNVLDNGIRFRRKIDEIGYANIKGLS